MLARHSVVPCGPCLLASEGTSVARGRERNTAMSERTNEAEVAAVADCARAYHDGSIAGDEKLLRDAFHPRACIVGNYPGELEWLTLEEYIAECTDEKDESAPSEWRIVGLSIEGDTALVRLRELYKGEWYSDDLSMLRVDGTWRIVHKTWYVHPSIS